MKRQLRHYLLLTPFLAGPSLATDQKPKLQFIDSLKPDEALAKRLLNILKHPELRQREYLEDGGRGNVAANDGFSYKGTNALHTRVNSRCLYWKTAIECGKWLDSYVSDHALKINDEGEVEATTEGDSSSLEQMVASAWVGAMDIEEGNNYRIWEVQARPGENNIFKGESTGTGDDIEADILAPEKLSVWRLKDDVREKSEQLGETAAERALADETEIENNVLPPMAKLRAMASVWTQTMRNRMLVGIGEIRAAKDGIEYDLGEDRPLCEDYYVKDKPLEMEYGPYLKNQRWDTLAYETRKNQVESDKKRLELCKKIREQSAYAANPVVVGDDIELGDVNTERKDEVDYRANLAAIDFVGFDPNNLPKPDAINYSRADLVSKLTNYNAGATSKTTYYATNAEQLNSYNTALEESGRFLDAAIERAPELAEIMGDPREFKIGVNQANAVKLNGLTDQMKLDYADTSLAGTAIYEESGQFTSDPDEGVEIAPSDLAIIPFGDE